MHTRTVRVASTDGLTSNHTNNANMLPTNASNQADHRRFIHLDISGGSNNFGSVGGSESASGGSGGTIQAKLKHVTSSQSTAPSRCNKTDSSHHMCHNCNAASGRNLFANNYISTTKYNLFTFLPRNLFEQFQKKANAYFLLVAIISLTPLSPKTPIVSVAPLVLVLTVSAIKEAIEDWNRYKMDKKINATRVDAWRHNGDANVNGHGFESIPWAELLVGDVVFVREGQAFPADIVLLQSSSDQGIANIETANLDGETNLKTKQAAPECWRIPVQNHGTSRGGQTRVGVPPARSSSSPVAGNGTSSEKGPTIAYHTSGGDEGLSSRSNPKSAREGTGMKWPLKLPPMVLESSPPSRKLDGSAWKGNLTFLGPTVAGGVAQGSHGEKIALGMTQLLLRGCVLRNTKWCIGVVLFTGVETKLMLNNRAAKLKRSHVDQIVDQSLYILFGIEFVLCTLGAIANYLWLAAYDADFWPLQRVSNVGQEAGLSWFTYLVLLDILIPISLYVSMELVKFTQAILISKDVDMYHAETNTPAQARTSNLNEELGQVSYIFSDKTGTLTCNVMNFVSCSVDGKVYGLGSKGGNGNGPSLGGQSGGTTPQANGRTINGGHRDMDDGSSPTEVYEPYSIPQLKGIPPIDPDFPFKDTSLVRSLLNGSKERGDTSLIDQFLTLLATCHTVLPDFPGCFKEHIHTHEDNCKFPVAYQASSPDEKALTIAAKNNSYYFFHREPMQIQVGQGANGVVNRGVEGESSGAARSSARLNNPTAGTHSRGPSTSSSGGAGGAAPTSMNINGEKMYVNILGTIWTFLILDSFEFTSERARMSVILIDPRDGLIKVFTKGSDTKMYKLLSEESKSPAIWTKQEQALNEFSKFGLRTLITGYKILTEQEYLSWAASYAKAKASIDKREEMVAAAQNDIEQGLTLLGATAIEDRLQDGVPQTISKLSQAGIKIWVLTGDKVETAINIARSCSLVTPKMDETGLIELIIDDKASDEEALAATKKQLDFAETKVSRLAGNLPEGESSDSLAIIVSGAALSHIFTVVRDSKGKEILYENLDASQKTQADLLRTQFLNVCKKCRAVVCCRVSPNQKAEVVSLVKTKLPDKITLAIGDGANDVSMIKAAHVGIGISGLEGLQAVMASDYSIAQFRFLEKLVLVHGHWSYERISKLILFSFYKNIAIAMTSIWFAIYSGFSAQLFYDPYAGSVYNIIFTSIPVMLAAVLDRDVSKKNLLRYPTLYTTGIHNECFNVKLLLRIIAEGFAHSVALYFGCMLLFTGAGDVVKSDGQTTDLWVFSTAMYSYLVLIVNIRLALDTSTFTWMNHLFFFLSVLAWFVFILIYCVIKVTPNMYYVSQWLFGSITFWLGYGLIPAICLVPEVAWLAFRRFYLPTQKDIVMELERGYGPNGLEGDHQHQGNVVLVRPQSPDRANGGGLGAGMNQRNGAGVTTGTRVPSVGGNSRPDSSTGSGSKRPTALVVKVSSRPTVGGAGGEDDSRPPSARNGLFPSESPVRGASRERDGQGGGGTAATTNVISPLNPPSVSHANSSSVHVSQLISPSGTYGSHGHTLSRPGSHQHGQGGGGSGGERSPNGSHRGPSYASVYGGYVSSPNNSSAGENKRKSANPGETMVTRKE